MSDQQREAEALDAQVFRILQGARYFAAKVDLDGPHPLGTPCAFGYEDLHKAIFAALVDAGKAAGEKDKEIGRLRTTLDWMENETKPPAAEPPAEKGEE